MTTIWDGIIIGGAGGAIAGITVYLVKYIHEKWTESRDKKTIYNWLKKTTSDKDDDPTFRSTKAIASWCNLTPERVKYICSIHEKIFLSTGDKDNLWSLYEREARSIYDERGVIDVSN